MNKKYHYRTMALRFDPETNKPKTLIEDTRSVEVIAATERPVSIFDWERYAVVDEVLRMDGCELADHRQVPLLDSHQRHNTSSVIGSFRGMALEGEKLVGRAYFAEAPESDGPFNKVRDGHVTDFSIGYRVLESVWVPEGERQTVNGREYTGPVKVATRWLPKELSVCPIGADEFAKARADAVPEPQRKEFAMKISDKLRAFLVGRGLPKEATNEEALKFLETLDFEGEGRADATPEPTATPEDAARAAVEAERHRSTEIRAMCSRFDVAQDVTEGFIASGESVEEARKQVMDIIAKQEPAEMPNFRVSTVGVDERDKFRSAAQDSLAIRGNLTIEKPAPGAEDLRGFSLKELARHSLVLSNEKATGNPLEMVGRALTTGDFPLILANTANKSLNFGWETAEETWQQWCSVGEVSDFKTHTKVRASETEDLEELPEGTPYKYGDRIEAQEQYSIATYGKMFALTRQTIINDDLSALTDIPMQHGEAAARKVGDIAYAILTANAAMGDGSALFVAGHSNLAGSGAAPSVTTLGAAITAMKKQKDLKGKRRLNIRPNFFIAPVAIEVATEQLFGTTFDPSKSIPGVQNPYSGNYFTRVYEPRLDDDSATAWYLAGPKGKTVAVFFLNGQRAPYMETKQGWSVDGVEYKVRIDAGAKALDWKGLYKNAGA